MRPTHCRGCGAPITQDYRQKTRIWCSRHCNARTLRAAKRRARRLAAQLARPRCVICSAPLRYDEPGWQLRRTTCSRKCSEKRWNWFLRKTA